MGNKERKRRKHCKEEETMKALKIWVDQKTEQHARIHAPLLKEKAKKLSENLGKEFEPSKAWIDLFKKRNGYKFKKEHGEKQATDHKAAEEFVANSLPKLLEEYSPNDVYNGDETALYYKGIPDRGYASKKVELSGGKKQKDRLTVLVCTNMTGTDRKKLLVIGKSKQPRGFPSDPSRLPVVYRHSENAWMTSKIFTEYLRNWDRSLRLQGRSILLLVDNCSAHPKVDGLAAIRLEFLPPNTTAAIQPCDQGIIRNLKCHYRSALNSIIISELDADEGKTASEVASRIPVIRALHLIYDAWHAVKPQTISNCFRKAGFAKEEENAVAPDQPQEEEEEEFQMLEGMNADEFNDFVDIDQEEPVTGELDDEEIVQAVLQKKQEQTKKEEEDGEKEEDEVSELEMPSPANLLKSVNTLRDFMHLSGLTSQSSFLTITNQIQRHITDQKTQAPMRFFF